MAKKINKVEIKIEVERDGTDVTVNESATLYVTTDEYPEFEHKKGIPIELTSPQKTTIINHVKNVVLPQAELAK